jgi:hypothetical protein
MQPFNLYPIYKRQNKTPQQRTRGLIFDVCQVEIMFDFKVLGHLLESASLNAICSNSLRDSAWLDALEQGDLIITASTVETIT